MKVSPAITRAPHRTPLQKVPFSQQSLAPPAPTRIGSFTAKETRVWIVPLEADAELLVTVSVVETDEESEKSTEISVPKVVSNFAKLGVFDQSVGVATTV